MKNDYYSPLTIAILNHLCFFAIDENWCCFRCGEVHEDAPIIAAIAHIKMKHPNKFPRTPIDLRSTRE